MHRERINKRFIVAKVTSRNGELSLVSLQFVHDAPCGAADWLVSIEGG
jgi:hypothetical protein